MDLNNALCIRFTFVMTHFLWQGAAIALLATVAVGSMRHASATVRYWVFVAALAVMAACVPVTFIASSPRTGPLGTAGTPEDSAALSAPATSPTSVNPSSAPESLAPHKAHASPRPAALSLREPSPGAFASETCRQAAPWVVAAYLTGVLLMLMRLLLALQAGHGLRARSRQITESAILAALSNAAKSLRLPIIPPIAWCQSVPVPTVVGILKPLILLPLSISNGLTTDQVEALLRHELAHLRRHDHWINLAQWVIETALFFHPAVWFISRRIRVEREIACDDMVLSTGVGQSHYAESLLRMAELSRRLMTLEHASSLALGLGAKHSSFGRRVLRLIKGTPHDPAVKIRMWPLLACMLIFITFLVSSAIHVQIGRAASGENMTKSVQAPAAGGDMKQQVWEQVFILRHYSTAIRPDIWAPAVRQLVGIGSPAVPELCAELRRDGEPYTQSAIAFALRAIGDRRAIPDLVDALQKAPWGINDYGLHLVDASLLEFMQKNQQSSNGLPTGFAFGQPRNEIIGALEKLTGHSEERNPRQIDQWPALWSTWWQAHQKEYLSSSQLDEIRSWESLSKDDAIEKAGMKAFGPYLPYGPGVQFGPIVECALPTGAYLDFDTGKQLSARDQEAFFAKLSQRTDYNGPEKSKFLWCLHESGFDVEASVREDLQYAGLQNHGCLAWRVDSSRWDTINDEIRQNNPLALENPKGAMWINPADKVPFPQTYLFRTRTDGVGIVRILGFDAQSGGVNLRYKMLDKGPGQTHNSK